MNEWQKSTIRRLQAEYELNMRMAEKFSHNAAFVEKFLTQAIRVESELRKMGVKI